MDLKLGDTQLIINECKKQGLLRNQAAYVLATAYHESAHTMKPIKEMGGLAYLKSKKYYPYFGRGYVQLTWDYNYKKAGVALGVDFIKNPDWLLLSQYAVPILVIGMRDGWFTGKSLKNYFSLTFSDFLNARRIINGMDQASLISGYAKDYDSLLKDSGYGLEDTQKPIQTITDVPAVVQPPLDHVPVVPPVTSRKPTLLDAIFTLLKAIFGRKQ